MKKYWLMKSEPEAYSFARLEKETTTWWEGVRNYQARNFMMNEMTVGDEVLFYHSNTTPPGVVGLASVSLGAQPDSTQFDKKSDYYDEKATKEKPRWYCAQVKFAKKFKNFVSLESLRNDKNLENMLVIQKGQRLSIQPVTESEFNHIKTLGGL